MQKSIKFFMMIFPAFFALVKPVSTMANPACIQKTSAAPIKNQNSTDIIHSSLTFQNTFDKVEDSDGGHLCPPLLPRDSRYFPGCRLSFYAFILLIV